MNSKCFLCFLLLKLKFYGSDFPQLQLLSDVESALLQQVLSLTPEQLSSLPPDQQQQVIQLQQALRRDQDQLQAS